MLPNNFAYIAIVTSLIGGISYIRSTLKGKTKPNRASWLIWTLAAITASLVQFSNGAMAAAIPIFMAGFIPLLVLLASFKNKNAYWKWSVLDYTCLILALFSIIAFVFFKTGILATIFAILADGLGFIPTFVKSWKDPDTENLGPFISGIFNPTLTMLTLSVFTFNTIGFAVYLFCGNLVEIIIVLYRRKIIK